MSRVNDLTGKKFGKLVVLRRCGRQGKHALWWTVCECGQEGFVRSDNLTQGRQTACGCQRRKGAK